jgi:polyisoprenoid-binding protein YceI
MKSRNLLIASAFPLAFVGYLAFHPGIAWATPRMTKLAAPTALRQSGSLTIDPMHTNVGFDIGHLGLSRVQGRFDKVSGSIEADSKDLSKSSVSITIQTASVDTAVAPRDADLRSDHFFNVDKFPELTFKSTHIRKRGGVYVADGDLTLLGVTKSISIPFKIYGPIKDPWGGTRIGIVADPVVLHRNDFGMTFDPAPLISDDVNIRISLEATVNKPS